MIKAEFKERLIDLFKKDRMTYPIKSKENCLADEDIICAIDETLPSKKRRILMRHLMRCFLCIKELKTELFSSRGIPLHHLKEAPPHLIDWKKVWARPNLDLDKEWEDV